MSKDDGTNSKELSLYDQTIDFNEVKQVNGIMCIIINVSCSNSIQNKNKKVDQSVFKNNKSIKI